MAKAPTISDVAAVLGMHKSSVSLALSGKGNLSARSRERVLAVAKELGYEPNPIAQRLAAGTANPTVCLFSGALDAGIATEKILLIQRGLSAEGLEVPIYTSEAGVSDHSQIAQIRQICRERPRAIICAAQMVDPSVFAELAIYQSNGGIVVSYDLPIPLLCDQVIFDREDNAYQAARYLLDNGHRAIGIGLTDSPDWPMDSATVLITPQSLRLQGFRKALEEFHLPIRQEWIFRNSAYERGGAEMAQAFLNLSERPTGVTIVNEYMALAFMVNVMRAGVRVTEDVSIVGHDDQPVAKYCPVPLTSVSQPTKRIAEEVVNMLLERLAGSKVEPRTLIIKGELTVRKSVGTAPA